MYIKNEIWEKLGVLSRKLLVQPQTVIDIYLHHVESCHDSIFRKWHFFRTWLLHLCHTVSRLNTSQTLVWDLNSELNFCFLLPHQSNRTVFTLWFLRRWSSLSGLAGPQRSRWRSAKKVWFRLPGLGGSRRWPPSRRKRGVGGWPGRPAGVVHGWGGRRDGNVRLLWSVHALKGQCGGKKNFLDSTIQVFSNVEVFFQWCWINALLAFTR